MKKNSSRGQNADDVDVDVDDDVGVLLLVVASSDDIMLKGLVPRLLGVVVVAVEGWRFVSPRTMLAASVPAVLGEAKSARIRLFSSALPATST